MLINLHHNHRLRTFARIAVCLVVALASGGCQTAYYKTMEAFGKEKRDILSSRVQAAREDQADAKKQFESALDRFSKLVNDDGGNLRKAYDNAKTDFDASEAKANDVRSRIKAVEDVGSDLFAEWKQEIGQYTSDSLKQRSQAQLKQTRAKYDEMLAAMKKAEGTMQPVLNAFHDNVLFLKHNLNAQAVASLKGTVTDLQRDITTLIREMEASIAEADAFVKDLAEPPAG